MAPGDVSIEFPQLPDVFAAIGARADFCHKRHVASSAIMLQLYFQKGWKTCFRLAPVSEPETTAL
jgi:hypothetical protein